MNAIKDKKNWPFLAIIGVLVIVIMFLLIFDVDIKIKGDDDGEAEPSQDEVQNILTTAEPQISTTLPTSQNSGQLEERQNFSATTSPKPRPRRSFGGQKPVLICPSGIRIIGKIKEKKPGTGQIWDATTPSHIPPDPFGILQLTQPDGTTRSEQIALRQDTYRFSAPFFRKANVALFPGTRINIELRDKDQFGQHDPITQKEWKLSNGLTLRSPAATFKISCNEPRQGGYL